jgi:hypothetical protein
MALNPVLRAAAQGVHDPEGCRVAILSYGEILGWPSINVGPLTLRGGEAQWRQSVAVAQPLWLGVAWNQIEKLEHEWQLDREDEQAEMERTKAQMAILQWTDSKTLEAGDYPAVITKIEETNGDFGPQFQIQFVILDADGEETDDEIRGYTSQKWGEKTKLYEWSRAILGKRCPGTGQPMDTDKLKGRKCDLRVEAKLNKLGQPKTSIAGIYPYQTISKAAADDDDDKPPF